jgi:hypothetical protein
VTSAYAFKAGDADTLGGTAASDYFKVTDRAGREYLLRHDREADEWYLVTDRGGVGMTRRAAVRRFR